MLARSRHASLTRRTVGRFTALIWPKVRKGSWINIRLRKNSGTARLPRQTHGAIDLPGIPFEDKGGFFKRRYYQDLAIERVMEAVADEAQRILLTLATGTGKTFIAFQIAWKLFHSRWNLSREPSRRPRILFLADRNILADQAYNAFSAFPEDALVRIDPGDIRKRGKVPKNGSLFFTIFQTL